MWSGQVQQKMLEAIASQRQHWQGRDIQPQLMILRQLVVF
jgi:hypothetical protein